MREIKFRAWNGSKLEYDVVVGRFGAFYGAGLDPKDSASFTPYNTIYSVGTPIMQYTGLKDKNGVEIYEGDIVFMHYFEEYRGLDGASEEEVTVCGVLEYRPDFAVYVVKLPNRDMVINDYCQEPSEELQVIGNIYENHELLKEVK